MNQNEGVRSQPSGTDTVSARVRSVAVLNQFALPRTEGGGTRHVDLFGRLKSWTPILVAGSRNHGSQARIETLDRRFRLVWVPPHNRGAVGRVAGWVIYGIQAFAVTVSRRRLDVVYGSSPHLLAPLAGLLAARLRRVPFVLEVRDLWPESIVAAGMLREGSTIHRVLSRLERTLACSAHSIVVVTPGWEEHFADLGVPVERLTVIPNGADLDEFAVRGSRENLRRDHGLTGYTAVFAGSHGPKDGIDLILAAAAELPEIDFVLVGDGAVKAARAEDARCRGLTNVQFRNAVPKSELAELLAACDVGIHAVSPLTVFDHGMSPNKLFDYMAAGLPVVSNARQGLKTVLRDGECGHVGGPESLAEGLRRVRAASVEERLAWSHRGREIILERYSRSVSAQRLESVLDAAASSRRASRRGSRAEGLNR